MAAALASCCCSLVYLFSSLYLHGDTGGLRFFAASFATAAYLHSAGFLLGQLKRVKKHPCTW